MSQTQRYSLTGIVLLVALRMAIGWQFLYEGLWKINSLSTPTPWTAEGYLKNSAGPFRSTFRELTGDANDFGWLDNDKVAGKWDDWRTLFVEHYGLSDKQQARLNEAIDGSKEFKVELAALPAGVTIKGPLAKVVSFDAKGKRLVCPGNMRMLSAERDSLLKLATGDDAATKAYHKAVGDLYKRATAKLSYKEQLKASLLGDPERAGTVLKEQEGTLDHKRLGEIELYKMQVARYEQNLGAAKQTFNFEHLKRQWSELQAQRSKLVGPVKALDLALQEDARKILTPEQLAMGPVSLPWSRMDWINYQTIAGLTILGFLLIAGLCTRPAAVAGAGLLMMFYLAMPPWPGVPEAPGPEHSFIINKNMIEVLALLAIAALPSGQWFGLDAVLSRLCCGKWKCCGKAACATEVPTAAS